MEPIFYQESKKYFKSLLNDLKIKDNEGKYPKRIFFMHEGKIILENDFETNSLYVNFKVWLVFKEFYHLSCKNIESLVKEMFEEKYQIEVKNILMSHSLSEIEI